jgi:P27 family predicted phage terminase small subunit
LEGVEESRLNRDEPVPDEGLVVPPAGLPHSAQDIWNRLAPDLISKRVLTSWDVDEFANGCRIQALLNRALRESEESPLISPGSNDNLVLNPAIRAVTSLEASLRSIWSRFGLTPGDRAQLKVDDGGGRRSGAARLLN